MIDINKIPSPCYVMEESLLRNNLSLIKHVKEQAGVNIILAFKAFAMWKAFPIVREYIPYSTASSKYEAQLAYEEMGSKAHTYSPAYTEADFPAILKYSSHVTFNSLSQYERFYPMVQAGGNNVSCGLRINPEYSDVETELYNPCAPGSRMGIISDLLGDKLPAGIEGLHFHTLCESTSYDLEKTLREVEKRFGRFLPHIKWLNMGGGHLMTRKGYDVEHLINLLKSFKADYPNLEIIMEPGSAFAWQTGFLLATVVDVVENHGIRTAIIDASFTCHMPDCLEMPYKPVIRQATEPGEGKYAYRIGGNSCLSGDYMGDWWFDKPLQAGDKLIFEDMIHYTIVKTTMFNGIPHPSLALWSKDGELVIYRSFGYEDYKNRMS
ncbi:carboxynorspermidine decarboxylase [Parabacteroides bouchesdurhonensis]|uniref:carboxynorspermidine decarboxylase n=1 Tax=Parabacteroides bouchesdurhonensis TaxID=1936995 RepID=UPI000E51B39F|nr:carboxynorspermidine decarboxylase [Parabacteroides bouchesdurhonensis]RHJ91326.1 carboxynorspermidine decarboxylase [Bacteroides sp. AM07-16]